MKQKQIGNMNNEIKKLYTALIDKGYSTNDIGDEATFGTKMSDKNSRKELYDYVSSKGDFRIGDYDTYEKRLSPVVSSAEMEQRERKGVESKFEQIDNQISHGLDPIKERLDNQQEYRDNFGIGQTVATTPKLNTESGEFESSYITPAGNKYQDKATADMESFRYRQAADMSISGQLSKVRRELDRLYQQQEDRASEVQEEWADD